MKKFSKILSVALLVALVLSLGVANAFAANPTLKVTDPVVGHKYSYFQLFTGDVSADGEKLSNVKWGEDAAASITIGTTEYTPVKDADVPEAVLTYLAGLTDEKVIADTIGAWVTGDGTVIPAAGVEVVPGYYVVKDAYTNADGDSYETTTLSTNIVKIIGDVTIKPKAGTTTHDKKVLDVNDTTDVALDLSNLQNIDASEWSTSADHDFGDHVPFKLTTKIGSDFAKYTSYYLAVNDTMYDGLVLDTTSIKVFVDGHEATKGTGDGQYSLTTSEKSFKVEFTKLNGNQYASAGKDVVVYYTATLDAATAKIGEPGNWNESYAEFSNNPNGEQTGHGTTPPDTAVVFTYKTDVNKVNKENKPLAGAEFTLTKALKNGSSVEVAVVRFKLVDDAESGKKVLTEIVTADGTITEHDATTFSFKGLDDGTYTLTETVTPDGYNTINPIVFKVVADHTRDAANKDGDITSLTVVDKDGNPLPDTIVFDVTPTEGKIETNVVNNSGTELPSTGGIGTTIFYAVGGILVLAAIVLLITKKRMSD